MNSTAYIHTPILFVPGLAGIFAAWDAKHRWSWAVMLGVIMLPATIYLAASNLFELLQYIVLVVAMHPAPRARWKLWAPIAGVAAMLAVAIRYRSYVWVQLVARWSTGDPAGRGYATSQSIAAMKQAGLWGQGVTAPLRTLPEMHSDFIFPYLVYTLGWIGGIALGLLVLFFVSQILAGMREVKEPFGSALARGMLTLFALRFGWNILMTLGFVPVTGADLPFVSHGGALQVPNLVLVGIVLSVFRRKSVATLPVANSG